MGADAVFACLQQICERDQVSKFMFFNVSLDFTRICSVHLIGKWILMLCLEYVCILITGRVIRW